MNIEQAKAIAIADILAKLELKPTRENETDATYYSPFRNEKTPSFHLNKIENVWFDHGEGEGGNAFQLVISILKYGGYSHQATDALRWIKNTNLDPLQITPRDRVKGKKSNWKLIDTRRLENVALLQYLVARGIDVEIAPKYLKEIYVQNVVTNTKIFAVGFQNEDGGYELRNKFFKSCVSPKTISFIRSDKPKPDGVMLFEGFMDFLTYATIHEGKLEHDVIVLNSVACVDHAIRYIKNYGYKYAYTWMDNDKAGMKANQRLAEFIASEPGLKLKVNNHLYNGFKDLNECHMHSSNLPPLELR
ncbi:toprim domain-containing protein [Mucilaginibacter pedocola]|uniref:Zinc finger CHC2-type domain-containing protein n=1 Tax=Mucilaginibacter pedocola TaxID=1792845 RepID=A0A1S9P8V7_9SPHI|nr:toprim domain-containing protein [Mucilaginibacter pedocola]OOQ57406.1 hypothetical protein BC343_15015 [Mucilaginibacter pedocola]